MTSMTLVRGTGPDLTDLDGTACATLIGFDVADPGGEVIRRDFIETPDRPDPLAIARELRRWEQADHPGHTFVVVGDARAHYLAWRSLRAEEGMEDLTPEAYLVSRGEWQALRAA